MIQAWLIRQLPWIVISAIVISSGFAMGWWLKEQGRKEMRPVIERLQGELDAERAARKRNEDALNAYTQELDLLRNRPRPSGPVRLCVTPSVQDSSTARSVDDSATASGGDTGQARVDLIAGPDIGVPLRNLAYGCDVENAKLRALQNWVKDVTQ
jgi:hypothetical protein